MIKEIDARGKNCPIPVVMAKKEIDAGATAFVVQVDNAVVVQNLQRLADSQGFRTTVEGSGEAYSVEFHRAPEDVQPPRADAEEICETPVQPKNWALLVARETLGEGDPELGRTLARMFFYALTQTEDLPQWVLCLNGGVKLATLDPQVAGHLRELEERGVQVLVCGTCLEYYGLTGQLQAGRVSNMYELLEQLQKAGKVVPF